MHLVELGWACSSCGTCASLRPSTGPPYPTLDTTCPPKGSPGTPYALPRTTHALQARAHCSRARIAQARAPAPCTMPRNTLFTGRSGALLWGCATRKPVAQLCARHHDTSRHVAAAPGPTWRATPCSCCTPFLGLRIPSSDPPITPPTLCPPAARRSILRGVLLTPACLWWWPSALLAADRFPNNWVLPPRGAPPCGQQVQLVDEQAAHGLAQHWAALCAVPPLACRTWRQE